MSVNEAALRLVISATNLTQEAFASLSSSLNDIAEALGKINGDSTEAESGLEDVSKQSGPMDALKTAIASVAEQIAPLAGDAEKATEPLSKMGEAAVPGLDATKAALGEVAAELKTVQTQAGETGAALAKEGESGAGGTEAGVAGGALAGGAAGGGAGAAAGEDTATSWTKAAGALAGFGTTLAITGAALGAVGAVSVVSSAKFQSAMEMIHTQAGASQQEVNKMSAAVLAMSGTVDAGPMQLAQALFHIESVGLRGSAALNVLKMSAEGAAAGGANLEDVTNALAAAMVSHIKGAQDASKAMGTLNAIVGAGNMHMQDLAAAMSSGILPAAQAAGLSFTDVGAALATLTDAGVPAQDAATRLRMTFSLLAAPTKQATTELASIGLSQLQLAQDMRSGGLLKALEDLKSHLTDTGLTADQQGEIIARAFGGGRSSSSIITLLDNLDRVKSKYKDISETAGKFSQDVAASSKTASVQWGEAWGKLQAAGVQLGNALAPAALAIANAIRGIAEAFSRLPPGMIKALADAILILAPALIGLGLAFMALGSIAKAVEGFQALQLILPKVGAAFSALLSPTGLIILGIIALAVVVYEIVTHWTEIKEFVIKLWTDIANWLAGVWNGIKQTVSKVWDDIKTFFAKWGLDVLAVLTGPIGMLVVYLATHWTQVKTEAAQIWMDIKNAILGVWNDIVGGVEKFIATLVGDVENAWKTVSGIVSSITSITSGIGNAVSGAVKGVEGLLGGSSSASTGTTTPRVPRMATGGMVNSPTLALVGESGPEAVLPLSQFPINQGAIGPLASSAGGAAPIINIYVSGNVTQNEKALADMVAERMQQRIKFRAQMEF